MIRFDALQPLSREHHQALSAAARITRASDDALDDLRATLADSFFPSLRAHFHEEERWIAPLLESVPALRHRLLDEHRQLLALMDTSTRDSLREFGRVLKAHVRFEEKELFEWLQHQYSEEALQAAWEGDDAGD